MTDKAMPDERNRRPDADAPTGGADDRGDASVARTSESAIAASKDGNERVDAPAPPSTKVAAPLITAVEIENFKGIGRPMRLEFSPITLLFGNNSAGKSTVLHALCYAHEILSHRNVDVHETEIGGDRIDLGGFRNLVHAHDPARTVRLRFELDLEDWSIPQGLDEKLASPLDAMGGNADSSVFQGSERPGSGWIELQAKLGDDEQPALSSYELGVNGARVGRLHARQPTGVSLEFSRTHPMLERTLGPRPVASWVDPERAAKPALTDTRADRAREATGTEGGGWNESRMEVLGLFSPLPHWNEILFLDDHGRSNDDGYDLDVFTAMVSALFVGIGQALRDELARVRYIGPVRDLHPQTTSAPSTRRRAFETFAADFIHGGGAVGTRPPHPASWADGSAAWTYLHDTPYRDLLDEVNRWIERRDRLDTGYALRVRSRVTMYEDDAGLVSEMREYHQLRRAYGNADGSVDLAGWSRAKANAIVDMIDPDCMKATLGHCDRLCEMFAGAATDGTSATESVHELARNVLQDAIEKFEARESIDIKPGIRREAQRNLRLAEDARRLLTLSAKDIESQITGSGEDLTDSSETLTPAHCRRLRDLLPKWEGDAPNRIFLTGVADGLRAMHDPDDLPEEVEATTRAMEDSRVRGAVSVEVERFLAEFRTALQASVASARGEYRRLTALVTKMEDGKFSSRELEELAGAIAAHQSEREVDLVTTKNALRVRVADVGVGVSQILPVVVAALDPDRPGVTAIEQPELHLHPRIQVELGDLFASQAAKGGIFLIETHSEHLLLRFMKRMRQTYDGTLGNGTPRMGPEDIAVYFVEIDPDGEQTLIREMPLNERGDLVEAWPGGFFEEDLREIF